MKTLKGLCLDPPQAPREIAERRDCLRTVPTHTHLPAHHVRFQLSVVSTKCNSFNLLIFVNLIEKQVNCVNACLSILGVAEWLKFNGSREPLCEVPLHTFAYFSTSFISFCIL